MKAANGSRGKIPQIVVDSFTATAIKWDRHARFVLFVCILLNGTSPQKGHCWQALRDNTGEYQVTNISNENRMHAIRWNWSYEFNVKPGAYVRCLCRQNKIIAILTAILKNPSATFLHHLLKVFCEVLPDKNDSHNEHPNLALQLTTIKLFHRRNMIQVSVFIELPFAHDITVERIQNTLVCQLQRIIKN